MFCHSGISIGPKYPAEYLTRLADVVGGNVKNLLSLLSNSLAFVALKLPLNGIIFEKA
jgi:hypothetical protein